MKIFISLIFGLLFLALFSNANANYGSNNTNKKIVELFTSQGCSSCPSADRLISEYASKKPNILALSYHVTYWNYLGWKDPYSNDFADIKQQEYAKYFGKNQSYTPQAIVQGKYEFVGSNKLKLDWALNQLNNNFNIEVGLKKTKNKLKISLPETSNVDANILLITYQKHSKNYVPSGENSGENLSHTNNVTSYNIIANWNGEPYSQNLEVEDSQGLAVLIQNKNNGEIIGANWLETTY